MIQRVEVACLCIPVQSKGSEVRSIKRREALASLASVRQGAVLGVIRWWHEAPVEGVEGVTRAVDAIGQFCARFVPVGGHVSV